MTRREFGETLFEGSCFVRGVLTPFLLLFCITMPLLIPRWTPAAVVVMSALELICVALLIGLWLPGRIARVAFRLVCAVVFLGYAAYLVDQLMHVSTRPTPTSRGQASPVTAIGGMLVIGLPSLWYALFGRFTFRAPREEIAEDEPDVDEAYKVDSDTFAVEESVREVESR